MSTKKYFIIGISGTTCSGKTTLVKKLQKAFKGCTTLHQDDYFLPEDDPRHVKIPELNHINWELFTSMDMERMRFDILNFIASARNDPNVTETNRPILILDGFLLFKCKTIVDLCDRKYFLTLDKEECCYRRTNRVYEPPDVPGYFEKIAWPEHLKYEAELMKDTDLCSTITFIDGSKPEEEIFQMVFRDMKELVS